MVVPQKNPNEKRQNIKTITWGDLTWVDIPEPTEEAKKYLAENYNFHPMDLEDCFSRRQLPKVDEYEGYLFVIF
ncbi:MAG: magnesium transporter, partial [Chloroflexi bacterium]|nr:magnesium transporter [Chloroflexota bacterium]